MIDVLWARVHAHLDAGGDPLEDQDLVDALAEHPAALGRVARLCDDLRALERAGPGRRPVERPAATAPRRAAARWLPWTALAAAAAAAVVLVPAAPRDEPAPPRVPAVAQRVLAFSATAVHAHAGVRVEQHLELNEAGRVVVRRATTHEWRADESLDRRRPHILSFSARVAE